MDGLTSSSDYLALIRIDGVLYTIDGSDSCNLAGFINHKFTANAIMCENGDITTLRDFVLNEELFLNYGENYWINKLLARDVYSAHKHYKCSYWIMMAWVHAVVPDDISTLTKHNKHVHAAWHSKKVVIFPKNTHMTNAQKKNRKKYMRKRKVEHKKVYHKSLYDALNTVMLCNIGSFENYYKLRVADPIIRTCIRFIQINFPEFELLKVVRANIGQQNIRRKLLVCSKDNIYTSISDGETVDVARWTQMYEVVKKQPKINLKHVDGLLTSIVPKSPIIHMKRINGKLTVIKKNT